MYPIVIGQKVGVPNHCLKTHFIHLKEPCFKLSIRHYSLLVSISVM
jgi:hypothetical protein